MPTSDLQILRAELGIPVALAYGNAMGAGNLAVLAELTHPTYGAKTRIAFMVLGEGEWDGINRLWVNERQVDATNSALVHFHPGLDGSGTLAPVSIGGDQQVDLFTTWLPNYSFTLSRKAYVAVLIPPDPGAPSADVTIRGDYRTMKVRQFDAAGTQTGYAFSVNPARQCHDYLIRTFVKREGLINEALSAAEKSRFDFAALADTAAFCDYDIGGGIKRCEGHVSFAQQLPATAVLEKFQLVGRFFILEVGGKFTIRPDQPRAYSFLLTSQHIKRASFTTDERSLRGAPNRFFGDCLDLGVPSLANIAAAPTGAVRSANKVTITLVSPCPYKTGDTVLLSGIADNSFNVSAVVTLVTSGYSFTFDQAGPNATSGGGQTGLWEQRYLKDSRQKDHENHQWAIGQRGAGLAAIPKRRDVRFDYGCNTPERVSRLLKTQVYRHLGADVPNWRAPREAQVVALLEAVDAIGNLLEAQLVGDTIRIDASIDAQNAGDYELLEATYSGFAARDGEDNSGEPETITMYLKEVVPEAFSDVADTIQATPPTPPGDGLPVGGGVSNRSYRPIDLLTTAYDAGTTATIVVPDFHMAIGGIASPVLYKGTTLPGRPRGTLQWIYVEDGSGRGGYCNFYTSQQREDTLLNPSWMLIDSIITPLAGAPETKGNNNGGAGAQTGRTSKLLPGTISSASWMNGPNGINGNDSDFASVEVANGIAIYEFSEFRSFIGTFSEITLRFLSKVLQLQAGATAYEKYSLDGGLSWQLARTIIAADGAPVESRIAVPLAQDLSKVRGRMEIPGPVGSPSGIPASVSQGAGLAWTLGSPSGPHEFYPAAWLNGDRVSATLFLRTLGIAIPLGANVTGIQVRFNAQGTETPEMTVRDSAVSLVEPAGGTTTRNTGLTWRPDYTTYVLGSANDLWGKPAGYWTQDKIQSPTFGLAIEVTMSHVDVIGAPENSIARVVSPSVTVFYTLGSTSGKAEFYAGEMEIKE